MLAKDDPILLYIEATAQLVSTVLVIEHDEPTALEPYLV